jgi:hypothetical protein
MDHPSELQPGSPGKYEFSAAENDVFAALAGKMRFVGTVLTIIGVLYLVIGAMLIFMALSGQDVPPAAAKASDGPTVMRLGVQHSIGYLVGGILYLAMGGWTRSGAAAFRRIVDTQGSDIGHLMEAAVNLRKLYTLQFWLILIGLIIMLIALVIGVVMLAGRAG